LAGGNVWPDFDDEPSVLKTGGFITTVSLLWCHPADVPDESGNLYLEATDPIPVYE
jgi:hypothetical protein